MGEDGKENRSRVRKAGRLHDHPLQRRYLALTFLIQKLKKSADEVLARCTAHAAVIEENRLLVGALEEVVVETNLTELVDEDGGVSQGRC